MDDLELDQFVNDLCEVAREVPALQGYTRVEILGMAAQYIRELNEQTKRMVEGKEKMSAENDELQARLRELKELVDKQPSEAKNRK